MSRGRKYGTVAKKMYVRKIQTKIEAYSILRRFVISVVRKVFLGNFCIFYTYYGIYTKIID